MGRSINLNSLQRPFLAVRRVIVQRRIGRVRTTSRKKSRSSSGRCRQRLQRTESPIWSCATCSDVPGRTRQPSGRNWRSSMARDKTRAGGSPRSSWSGHRCQSRSVPDCIFLHRGCAAIAVVTGHAFLLAGDRAGCGGRQESEACPVDHVPAHFVRRFIFRAASVALWKS